MEIYIQLILIVATLKYCLKAASNSRFRTVLLYAAGASVLAFSLYPLVINQPLDIIERLLADRELVSDWAVVVTIEAVAGILISVRLLENYFRPKNKRSRAMKTIKVIPGILFIVAVAYFELEFFRLRAGEDFTATAALYSASVFSVVTGCSFILKKVLPGESMKLEMKMLLNLGILAAGLLVNSSVADYGKSSAVSETDLSALAGICTVTAVFAFTGFCISRYFPDIKLGHILKKYFNTIK